MQRPRVEHGCRRHPEIDEQPIVALLIGLGQPRTGSTAPLGFRHCEAVSTASSSDTADCRHCFRAAAPSAVLPTRRAMAVRSIRTTMLLSTRARIVRASFLRRIVFDGDDVSVELESEPGRTRFDGMTAPSTFRIGNPDIGGLNLQQGGARFTWDGQSAYGMVERSSHERLTRID
ncbi:MAG: hypothetical protein QM661_06805 [Solimonas sp.]